MQREREGGRKGRMDKERASACKTGPFETSKPTSSDTPSTMPHLLILLKTVLSTGDQFRYEPVVTILFQTTEFAVKKIC